MLGNCVIAKTLDTVKPDELFFFKKFRPRSKGEAMVSVRVTDLVLRLCLGLGLNAYGYVPGHLQRSG